MTHKKPHVMHVIDSLAPGGAERMLVDIVNNIDRDNFSVSVCITRSNHALSKELHQDIPFMALDRKWRFDPKGFTRLKQFSNKQKVDIYHVHSRSTLKFLLTTRLLGFCRSPIVFHDHFGSLHIDNSVPLWFKYQGVKQLAHYIGVCDGLGKWAANASVPGEMISVIGNGLDLGRFENISPLNLHKRLDIPADKLIGIAVGTIRADKGIDLLIDACSHFPEKDLPHFVIVGKEIDDAFNDLCKKKIVELGLGEYFHCVGVQENALSWIKGADFAVMSARSESGPLVLIEYMLCKVPFAAFNVGWVSNLIYQYFPNFFSEPCDTEQLYQQLSQLTKGKPNDLSDRSLIAYDLAKKLFNIKDRIPIIENIYKQVLG